VISNVVRIALLGCGTVGASLLELLEKQAAQIAKRQALELEVAAIAVSDLAKQRPEVVPTELLSDNAAEVVSRDDIDVVVELMGGTNPTLDLVLSALKAGKPVVTANKELLARHGEQVFKAAAGTGVEVHFEAAVAGGIPLIRPLQVSLAGEKIHTIMGIVNGTTNFILTQMAEHAVSYEVALAEAQKLGYAERDPTADVEGHDAAAKAAILAAIASDSPVGLADVHCEGISHLRLDDLEAAQKLGFVVKLLAVIDLREGEMMIRVHPALLPAAHPLASVRDAFNAVFVEGEAVGELMFYGPGAGGSPTASAVLGDLIEAAREVRDGRSQGAGSTEVDSGEDFAPSSRRPSPRRPSQSRPAPQAAGRKLRILPIEELTTCYYLSVDVIDRPGVLSMVSGVFGRHKVSIRWMEQDGLGQDARLIFLTHLAVEKNMQAAVAELRTLEVVRQVNTLMKVMGGQ